MVSRIYSPYTPVYSPNPVKHSGSESGAEKDPFKDPNHKERHAFHQDIIEEHAAQQGSNQVLTADVAFTGTPSATQPTQTNTAFQGLAPDGPAMASIQEQAHHQQINIGTILKDFQSTANALGIDAGLQSEVAGYINVIQTQATKDTPSVPYIKHTLSTASVSLDSYISKTLGQPSTVVKDWIDALFLQDINFKTAEAPQGTPPSQTNHTTSANSSSFDLSDPTVLKDLWQQARTAFKTGDTTTALTHLENGLTTINHVDQPELAGRFHHRAAKLYESEGRLDEAQAHYHSIIELADTKNLNTQKADSYLALAHFAERKQSENPSSFYRQASHYAQLAEDYQTHAFSQNSLAHYQLSQGDTTTAINTLSQAIKSAQDTLPNEPALLSDLYTNLGHAAQQHNNIKLAARSYKMAVQLAERAKEHTAWAQGIHTLANLYSEANQPMKASETMALLSQTI